MPSDDATQRALGWIEELSEHIGPRRPTGDAERRAAEWVRDRLAEAGMTPSLEPFEGLASFAGPVSVPLALAAAPALLPRRSRLGRALALAGLAAGLAEDDLRLSPVQRALATQASQNVVAAIEPAGETRRTICLVSHLDSSRSGLLFHQALGPHLRGLLRAVSVSVAISAASPVLERFRGGRVAVGSARALLVAGLGLLAERELRGADVPGANDNASGVAVAGALVLELAAAPLASSRVVFLATGCEESGTIGMRAFLESHDTAGWLFVNLDGVAAPATLRYLPREGVGRTWRADPGLVRVAESVSRDFPELGLVPARDLAGLTYDATQVLARGGRAITLSAQDRTIPDYHAPSDSMANADADVVGRALAVTREMLSRLDRGAADSG